MLVKVVVVLLSTAMKRVPMMWHNIFVVVHSTPKSFDIAILSYIVGCLCCMCNVLVSTVFVQVSHTKRELPTPVGTWCL